MIDKSKQKGLDEAYRALEEYKNELEKSDPKYAELMSVYRKARDAYLRETREKK